MKNRSFILFPGGSSWRIAMVEGRAVQWSETPLTDKGPQDMAEQLAAHLANQGREAEAAVLAIPSAWCLAAPISIGDLPPGDRKALLYRLEERLPLPAEGVIADFILPSNDEKAAATSTRTMALGVCTTVERIQPLVEAMESAGVSIGAIAPAAVLAASHISDSTPPGAADADRWLLLGEPDGAVSILAFHHGRLASWALTTADAAAIKLQWDVQTASTRQPPAIFTYGLEPSLAKLLSHALGIEMTAGEGNWEQAAAEAGAAVAAGEQAPWISFRSGPLAIADRLALYRPALNLLLGAAAALLVCLAGAMLVRSVRHDHERQTAEARMVELFREKFPGWPIPINIKAVIRSEKQAMGQTVTALPEDMQQSALLLLINVMSKLPKDPHAIVTRMTIAETDFLMEGRLRAYEDLDVLASAVRAAGLVVPTPDASKDAEGYWSFKLHGSRATKPSAPQARAGGAG